MKVGDKVYRVRVSYGNVEFGEAEILEVTKKQVRIGGCTGKGPLISRESAFDYKRVLSKDDVFLTPEAAWAHALPTVREKIDFVKAELQKWRSAEGVILSNLPDAKLIVKEE